MKKLFLFFLIFLQTAISFAQTNVYHPFPSDSAVWNVSYEDYWNYDCLKYSYSITGDTAINSVTYHKIWQQGERFFMQTNSGPGPQVFCTNQLTGTYSRYKGAIREDIVQKKVYFLPPSLSRDTLLYDFTLNVGDTVKGYFAMYDPIVIKSVDSTLIGMQYRKTWNIDPMCGWGGPTPRIIEGVGSIFGLLELPCGIEKSSRTLLCFSENNKTLYPNYNGSSACTIINSVTEKENIKNVVQIFPNPSNGKFQLTLNFLKGSTFEIMDVLGNTILKSEIKNETTEMDLSDYKSGIYFVRITDSKGNFVVKKIIKE